MEENGESQGNAGFGPYESVRSLTESSLQGVRDATRVFDGFVSMLEQGLGAGAVGGSPGETADKQRDPAPDGEGPTFDGATADGEIPLADARALVSRLGDLYLNVVMKTLDSSFDAFASRSRGAVSGLAGRGGAGVFVTSSPGEIAIGDLYVHNHEAEPTQSLTFVATGLNSAAGEQIPAGQLRIEPAAVDGVGAGATVRVEVSVIAPTTPGVYHGLILVAELPDEQVPVRLTVEALDSQEQANGSSGPSKRS